MSYIDCGSELTTYPYINIKDLTPPLNPCLIVPPQSNLFLWMDSAYTTSYPGTGSSWFDMSPTGKVGTLVNGPFFKSDNCGVFQCDAVDDYIIPNVNHTEILTQSEYTISFWFNPRINLSLRSILSFGGTIATTNPILLLRSNGSTTYRIYFQGNYMITTTYVIGQWQNFTMVRTGGRRKTYKNGVLLNDRVYGESAGNAAPLWLNAGFGGRGGCDFGVVNMWKRGFTDTEVLDLFNQYKTRFGL
jgi:hypothetical protein